MAFIPISPAHQTGWHKTKPFPPSKRYSPLRGKHNSSNRQKSTNAFSIHRKSDAFWDFTLHRLKFYLLNMLGNKQKLVKVAARVTLDRMWQAQVQFRFADTFQIVMYFTRLTFTTAFYHSRPVLEEPLFYLFIVLLVFL